MRPSPAKAAAPGAAPPSTPVGCAGRYAQDDPEFGQHFALELPLTRLSPSLSLEMDLSSDRPISVRDLRLFNGPHQPELIEEPDEAAFEALVRRKVGALGETLDPVDLGALYRLARSVQRQDEETLCEARLLMRQARVLLGDQGRMTALVGQRCVTVVSRDLGLNGPTVRRAIGRLLPPQGRRPRIFGRGLRAQVRESGLLEPQVVWALVHYGWTPEIGDEPDHYGIPPQAMVRAGMQALRDWQLTGPSLDPALELRRAAAELVAGAEHDVD